MTTEQPFNIRFEMRREREGARFAKMLGEATIVPIHYEGWSHLTEGRDEIEQTFTAAGLEKRLRFLPFGQPVSIDI
jgi:L-ascorbate metabolism protein UlaG (beta-lactamase superfamily)